MSTLKTHYKNPSYPEYQYALIGDGGDKNLKRRAREMYNYLMTDKFQIDINATDIHPTVISPISELILNKSECMERRFFFEIRLAYADVFTEVEDGTGVIETADDPVREPAVTPPL